MTQIKIWAWSDWSFLMQSRKWSLFLVLIRNPWPRRKLLRIRVVRLVSKVSVCVSVTSPDAWDCIVSASKPIDFAVRTAFARIVSIMRIIRIFETQFLRKLRPKIRLPSNLRSKRLMIRLSFMPEDVTVPRQGVRKGTANALMQGSDVLVFVNVLVAKMTK